MAFLMLICLQVENCLRKTCVAIKKLAFFRQLALNFVCLVNPFIIFLQFSLQLA